VAGFPQEEPHGTNVGGEVSSNPTQTKLPMGNSITGINDDIISQGVLDGFVAAILPLSVFTTSFSADAARRGDKISIPRVGAQDAAVTKSPSADYTIQDLDSDAAQITLGEPVYVSGGLSDVEVASSSVLSLELYGKQKGFQLGKKVFQTILGNVTAANFGAAGFNGAPGAFDLDAVIDLATNCSTDNMPEDMRALVVNELYFANLMKDSAVNQFNTYGSVDPLHNNRIPRLAGFDVHKSTIIPNNGEYLVGFAGHPSALAVAIRYLAPQSGQAYIRAEALTDATTGITIGIREWYDEDSGVLKKVWECCFGSVAGIGEGLKRITND